MNDDWHETTLGQVARITIGRTPPRKEQKYWTSDLSRPFCTIADMDDITINPKREGVTEVAVLDGKAKRVPAGALLMSFKLTIGRVGFAAKDLYPNEAIAWLDVTDPRVDLRYLAYWLGSRDLTEGSGRAVKGETLNSGSLRAISVSFPSLEVQRRIVDLMGHLDAHLANLRAEQAAARDALNRMRSELTSGADFVPLSSLAAQDGIQIGPFGSQLHAREYAATGTPVVMPRDLLGGRISEEKIKRVDETTARRLARHRLQEGDIVFPRRGDLSKRAYVGPHQTGWLCGTGCIRFRPAPGVGGQHVFESISGDASTAWLIEHAVGTTMLNLNTEIVSRLPVAAPSGSDPLAQACASTASIVVTLGTEVESATQFRTSVLAALMRRNIEITAAYDCLLAGVA